MIVSASYKTDIPALYGRWFMNRLGAGSCRVVNPWGGQVHEVSLERDALDGLVFWTRNAEPFLESLTGSNIDRLAEDARSTAIGDF